MEFEKEFNIAIPDDQAEKISTVGRAVDYISKNAALVGLTRPFSSLGTPSRSGLDWAP